MFDLRDQAKKGDDEKLMVLGHLAFRDSNFLNTYRSIKVPGDQVASSQWKRDLASFIGAREVHPSFAMGLRDRHDSLHHLLSYMFVHSGWSHLLGNVFFLLIFGCVIEPAFGSLMLGALFLLGGIFAGCFYILSSGLTAAPLIGSSGAVSALMAYFSLMYFKTPVRFIYWLLIPSKRYTGFIFLPSFLVLTLWILSDFTGLLSASTDFGGVAYTAHLGGELFGLFAASLVLLITYRKRKQFLCPSANPEFKIGQTVPLDQLVVQTSKTHL